MKNSLVFSLFTALLIFGATSCNKCQVCTKPSEAEVRICKDDYSSETEYGFNIDLKESQGYNCKSSI